MPLFDSDERKVPVENPEKHQPAPRGRRLKVFLEYFTSLIATSGWQLGATVVLMVFTSITEASGVALLFPVLQAAGLNMTNESHVGHYTAEVRTLLVRSGLRPGAWLAALLMIFMLLMTLRSLFSRVEAVWTFRTVVGYEMALSRKLYQAITNADWLFLARRRSSDFTHALTGELSRVTGATHQFIGFLASMTLVLIYVALAFKLAWGTTLMVLAAGAILLFLSEGRMRAGYESGTALSESMSAVYSVSSEHLQNLKSIKMYDAQAADLKMFTDLENSALQESLHGARNQAAAAFWFEAGSLVLLAAVILVSIRVLRVGPANILLLLAIFTRLMPRLAASNAQLQGFLSDLPAFERIVKLEKDCTAHAESATRTDTALALRRELRLEEVGFRYEAHRPSVLEGLSLSIAVGKITAITGSSGSGKSTIADLVNGLLTPDSGRIVLDGEPLTPHLARAWRSQVGYVAQDTVLFHTTVRRNLLWAQQSATEKDLRRALSLAAADFVFELPQGLDTTVGDRGVLLSSGQRQRIALARALLRNPSLLILDEATNSLDLENERRIFDTIEQFKGQTTILMIAHRASAIQRAEMIYVLEGGRVAASGTWATLTAQPSGLAGALIFLQEPAI
jgi:ATP-binding cassette, subfamily C, bacterial